MSPSEIDRILDRMEPGPAAAGLAAAVRRILPLLGEEERARIVQDMFGQEAGDRVGSLVHL